MNKDHPKFARIFTIIRLLTSRSKGISLAEISKAINKSERTVYRYLKLLRDLGFTLETIEAKDETFYRLKKNKADVSEIFDYLPGINYAAQVPLPPATLQKFEHPVWIYKGRKVNEYIVYDSLIALTEQHPVDNADTLYAKLRKTTIAIYPTCRVIRAPFFKRLKTRK